MEAGKDTSFEEQKHEYVIGGVVNGLNRTTSSVTTWLSRPKI